MPSESTSLQRVSTLDLARWQFAITTLFHFIFVPISIGLALFVAICQTCYQRTGDEVYLRMTRFWGKFLLISMAIGVVTGIVEEFQFGMNWSVYSRYVGAVFGAPLAMEGLVAFFLESTFVGLWIFGWGRLSPRVHLATIWLTAIGTILSAYFIIAANSWMQHPVGYRLVHGRAVLTNIWAVLFNNLLWLGFPHTILGSFTTGGMLVVAVCGWLLLRGRASRLVYRSLRMALPFVAVSVLAAMVLGDGQGRLLIHQQPMKMAAAEAVYHSGKGKGFSIFSYGAFKAVPVHVHSVRIPHLLSLIEDLSWNGRIAGIDNIQAAERHLYGPGNYIPIVGVEYWTFRLMIGAGVLMLVIALVGLWVMRRRQRTESARWFQRLALLGLPLPILANWCGWIFTEVGRQPWVVFGLLRTADARSPGISSAYIAATLGGYIVIYGVLIAIGGWLMWRELRHGPEPDPQPGEQPPATGGGAGDDLVLAY